ncbi:MAG: hypothetical protein LBT95_08840, partial [Treponema sp.]|nr:hypothetical protein [Treponema sp.]
PLTEALHHPILKHNDKTSSCKASVTPMGILPSQTVIFVTLQQLVIKVNAGPWVLFQAFVIF